MGITNKAIVIAYIKSRTVAHIIVRTIKILIETKHKFIFILFAI